MYDSAMYAIFGAAVILVSAFIYIAYLYREIVSRYNELSKENSRLKDEASEEAELIKKAAIEESRRLLTIASESAKKIITDADYVSKDTKFEFSKKLNEVLDAELNITKETLSWAAAKSTAATEGISEDTRKFAETLVASFHKALEEEIQKNTSEFTKISKKAMDGVDAELLAYKNAKMENIDQLAVKIAQDIAKQIIGKTLTYEEHEAMVLEALTEAKKKNII